MKNIILYFSISVGVFAQVPAPVAKPSPLPKPVYKKTKQPDIVATITAPDNSVRTVHYNDRIIETIHAKLNYTTVFVLPSNEKVLDIVCGNTDEWTLNGSSGINLAYVRPDRAKSRTNINLATVSGNVYSFQIVEGDGNPDLKVFVDTKDSEMLAAANGKPKWVPALELEAAKKDAESSKKQANEAIESAHRLSTEEKERAEWEIAAFRSGFPSSLKHDYVVKEKQQHEFGYHAMAHSKDFTYIWCDPSETPTLYEKRDGKPALIEFAYSNGVYIAPKVLGSGYLTIGKKKMEFYRAGN